MSESRILPQEEKEEEEHWLAPFAVGIAVFGAGTLAILLYSITTPDPLFTRTRLTALLSLLLATPALAIYFYNAGRYPLGVWWRTLWSLALLAYLLHFWWAFVLTFGADASAVARRQSLLVAISNFAVTILWTLDVVAAQLGLKGSLVAWLRFATHVLVLVSFALATVVFRSGLTFFVGALALGVVAAAVIARLLERRHAGRARAAVGE